MRDTIFDKTVLENKQIKQLKMWRTVIFNTSYSIFIKILRSHKLY